MNKIIKKSIVLYLALNIPLSLTSDKRFDNVKIKINDDKIITTYVDNDRKIDKSFYQEARRQQIERKKLEKEKQIKNDNVNIDVKKDISESNKENSKNENENIKEEKDDIEKELYEYQINSSLIKEYNVTDSCIFIQGGVVTNDNIIIARYRSDISRTYLYKIDKTTYEVIDVVDTNYLGHSNDMTYIDDLDLIISTGKDNYKKVVFMDSNTLEVISEVETEHKYFGISYDKENKYFVALGGKNMYILNQNFNEINTFEIPNNLTKQSVAIKNELVYYLCYESGIKSLYQSSFDLKRANTNYIFVYDLNGKLVRKYYLPTFKGEAESIMFNEDKLLIGVNGNNFNSWKIYEVDINLENIISKSKVIK